MQGEEHRGQAMRLMTVIDRKNEEIKGLKKEMSKKDKLITRLGVQSE